MKIFVTGATGFVGGALARSLANEHDVNVLAPRPAGDLREPIERDLLPESVDVVIHAAGLVGATNLPHEAYTEANVDGTVNAARAAVAMNARQFVLLSTGGVYRPSDAPLTESSEVVPHGDYAISKYAAETAAMQFRSDLRVKILRLFFPYGPGQSNERLIPRLIHRIIRGEEVFDGPRLNPLYIDDLVESVQRILAIDEDVVVNLAGAEVVSMREICESIGRIAGVTPRITAGQSSSWIGDIAHAVKLTGYRPAVSFEDGLARTCATISRI